MNAWIQKSIELANSPHYLDMLLDIYTMGPNRIRDIPEGISAEIKKSFDEKRRKDLIENLLKLKKFPIDHPYVASLRKYRFLIGQNPKTVKKIGDTLLSMDYEALLKLTAVPKSGSRQFGQSFKIWLKQINIPFFTEDKFRKSFQTCFLSGDDERLQNFARREYEIRLNRGLDFILKVNSSVYLGEAKFLSDNGGQQDDRFRHTMRLARLKKGKVSGLAILDGILWFDGNQYMNRTIRSAQVLAMSALLLNSFIHNQTQ